VGSIAGQIARIKGARIIEIAGGTDKTRRIVEEFGVGNSSSQCFSSRLAVDPSGGHQTQCRHGDEGALATTSRGVG
jgi:hypothetical protein